MLKYFMVLWKYTDSDPDFNAKKLCSGILDLCYFGIKPTGQAQILEALDRKRILGTALYKIKVSIFDQVRSILMEIKFLFVVCKTSRIVQKLHPVAIESCWNKIFACVYHIDL